MKRSGNTHLVATGFPDNCARFRSSGIRADGGYASLRLAGAGVL